MGITINVDGEEFESVIAKILEQLLKKYNFQLISPPEAPKEDIIHGIKGLSIFLSCSIPTAQKIKHAHPEICYYVNRKVFFKSTEILLALKKVKSEGWGNRNIKNRRI